MLKSMTAFARVSSKPGKQGWIAEIRSINHRFFEISLKLPPELHILEDRIREIIRAKISRGKITVSLTPAVSEQDQKPFVVDEKNVKRYLDLFKRLKKKYKLDGEIRLNDLIRLPGLFEVEKNRGGGEDCWPELALVVKHAVDKALTGKEVEGRKIAQDMLERLADIRKALGKVEKLILGKEDYYFRKMKERVSQLLGESFTDNERIFREVAFLAEKSDVTEEVVRMKSHLDLFNNKIHAKANSGRELDFLCQEMHREINTLGSKAQFFEISREVVFMKGEIEKIREQIQNVE